MRPGVHRDTGIPRLRYDLETFSVLIGIAVADIATCSHQLVRNKEPVVWDPLVLLAALRNRAVQYAGVLILIGTQLWHDALYAIN